VNKVVKSGTKWWKVVSISMFMGEYNHTIDTKGRLIIPSKFREVLGDDFVVTKGLDGCLFVYDNAEWNTFEEKLKALPLMNKESRKFVRFFLAGASNVEVDKQGRILLPSVLREFAGLDKDVVLVGVGGRIEIWSKERWSDASEYEDMDDIAEHMSELGLMI
jgi:MraZ protein